MTDPSPLLSSYLQDLPLWMGISLAVGPYLGLLVALPTLRARLPAALRARGADPVGPLPAEASSPSPAAQIYDLFLRPLEDLASGLRGQPPHLEPSGVPLPPDAAIQVRMFQLWSGVLRAGGPLGIFAASAGAWGLPTAAVGWLTAWFLGSIVVTRGGRRFARYACMPYAVQPPPGAEAKTTD